MWEEYVVSSFGGNIVYSSENWKVINCSSPDVFFDNFEDEKNSMLW